VTMGNKKSTPVIEEEKATEWDGNFVDCESVDWGVSEPIPERDNVRTLRATVFGTGKTNCIWAQEHFLLFVRRGREELFADQVVL